MQDLVITIIPYLIKLILLIIFIMSFKTGLYFFEKKNFDSLTAEQTKKFITEKNKNKYLLKLSKNGYLYRKNDYNFEVSTYFIYKIGLAILFFIVAYSLVNNTNFSTFAIPSGILGIIFGYKYLDINHKIKNNQDNEAMDTDVRNLRDTMIIHAEAGIPIKDTIMICKEETENKRFKQGLNEFLNNLLSQKLNIKESLEVFESRFDNEKIKELCIIIDQAEETGRSAEMISGLIEKAEIEQEGENYKVEKKLERKMMFVCLIYFGLILVNVFYSIASSFDGVMGSF